MNHQLHLFTKRKPRKLPECKEFCQPIPSCPGYWATPGGQIIGRRGWILSPVAVKGGYLRVGVTVNGKHTCHLVHRLVCEAFRGQPSSDAYHAAHRDHDPANNRPSNLRWATPIENAQDKRSNGSFIAGERAPNAKLTREKVNEIREFYRQHRHGRQLEPGQRQQLASKYGVSGSTISNAVERHWNSGDGGVS
jgi:hypothetical protein